MRFYLPRRHRRQLLFPPGLLALAGLLWLGCVAVGSWRERLMRRTVLQLTMPPKPVSDTIYQFKLFSGAYSHEQQSIPFLYSQLFTLYSWQNIKFTGNPAHDSLAAISVSRNIQRMRTDTIPNCGISIWLTPEATYKCVIKLLDLMTLNDQKKHLFDMYHGPFTLYVLVDDYTPQPVEAKPEFVDFCGTNATMANYGPQPIPGYWSVSYATRIGNWLAAIWNPKLKDTTWYTSAVGTGTEYDITLKLEMQYLPHLLMKLLGSFIRSEWRIQFLLIICIAAINWWKIKRQLRLN